MGLDDTSKLGFPLSDFVRTFTWYGGSSTGRTVYYLYRGQSDLLDDSYPDIKGQGSPLNDGATDATMPLASKLNAQQSATIQASVSSAEEAQNLKNRFSNFLSDLNNGNEFTLIDGTAVNCKEVVADGTPNEMSVDEMKTKITDFIDMIQTTNTPLEFNSDKGQIHLCVELNHQISEYSEQIMSAEEDRLRLWISVYGAVGGSGNTRKVATINLCLSSAFAKLNDEGKPEVVSTTDTEPFGESGGLAISDIAQTYRNGNFTFFDAGNMTSKDVQTYNRILKRHYIG